MKRIICQWINAKPREGSFDSIGGEGQFVKDFEYSQGYFTCWMTNDPTKAFDFTEKENLFKTFFDKRGALLREIEINVVWGKNLC